MARNGGKSRRATATVIHLTALIAFLAVWLWHLTPEANDQEVAKKRGWFFNYLTFFSFTLQLLQFCCCLASDFFQSRSYTVLADDISCAVFPVANFVTLSYYALLLSGNIVDSDEVPAWVSPVLHTGNTVALWLDQLVAQRERTFSNKAAWGASSVIVLYMAWCYATKQLNNEYPYAFMNKMPAPWDLLGTGFVLLVAVQAIFFVGRRFLTKRVVQRRRKLKR